MPSSKPTPYQLMMLASLIEEPGWSQEELVDLIGIPASYVAAKMATKAAHIGQIKGRDY